MRCMRSKHSPNPSKAGETGGIDLGLGWGFGYMAWL